MFGSYFWFVLFLGFCIVFTMVEVLLWWHGSKKISFDVKIERKNF
uniref:ATP synthase F0 subunit 8 n=1 Tax=Brachidontes mutabilis TaxID=221498 RepID=A0A516EZC8_9BIVA|nr:ATP synthase F0 subunit 8 [Brachidontes mutabilis]